MTGPEHYREAERMIEAADGVDTPDLVINAGVAQYLMTRALVHATLAVAAASAPLIGEIEECESIWAEWRRIAL